MRLEKSVKRMTLREVLIHAEKCSRDLVEQFHGDVLPHVSDYRDLNRPIRRRSHYPTMQTLVNSQRSLEHSLEEAMTLCDYLLEQLATIRESARKEMMQRL